MENTHLLGAMLANSVNQTTTRAALVFPENDLHQHSVSPLAAVSVRVSAHQKQRACGCHMWGQT